MCLILQVNTVVIEKDLMTGGFCLLQLLTRLVIFFSIRLSYGKSSSTLMYSHN